MRFLSSFSKFFALLALVAMLVIANPVFSSPAEAANYKVIMGAKGLKFKPKKLTVHPGDTITFKNGKLAPHNVVFKAKKTGNKKLAKLLSHKELLKEENGSFDVTIPSDAKPGKYKFFCIPHKGAGMKGKMTIE